ncbi:MAG: hypothetical protein KBS56_05365 [Clostridiales bacterium]|nr:hypothetical protein [Candidatus Crickella equi]
MYSKLPNLVVGFHGCDKSVYDKVIKERKALKPSNNKYDWLGNGIYFWEQDYDRALDWAKQNGNIKESAVVGAILDLGNCLNLVDAHNNKILKLGYELLKINSKIIGADLPQNRAVGDNDHDVLLRDLDCAVIQQIHTAIKAGAQSDPDYTPYDSVRGAFIEGNEVYPGSQFREKTHMQICIVNPNCIKGYFDPLTSDANYPMP